MPERFTLRYWPWLIMSTVGAAAFAALGLLLGSVALNTPNPITLLITGSFTILLAVLVVYTVASLRMRTVVDSSGVTTRGAFTRLYVPWAKVDRLDIMHSLPGWAVRAWMKDGQRAVVFLCHDTSGRRPKPESFDEPPPHAPIALRDGFLLLDKYRRSAH